MKLEFKGFLHKIEDAREVGDTTIQDVIIRKPAFTDEFGDKRGKDDYYQCTVFNDKTALLDTLKVGDRVSVTAYLNGREFDKKDEGGKGYSNNITINKIEKVAVKAPAE